MTAHTTETLSALENEILDGIEARTGSVSDETKAFIVYRDEQTGRIEFGPCRWAHRNNLITSTGTESTWSVSPFPGAWAMVPRSAILRVRHATTMR